MNQRSLSHRLSTLLWILVLVPSATVIATELNKRLLIWRIRIVDFVDLVFLAPFFLIILLSLHATVFANRSRRSSYWLSLALIGIFLYGHSMHLTGNAINTYSTEIHNYIDRLPADTYELIYFFDEVLGHLLLYGALFGLLGLWTVENDLIHERNWSTFSSGILFGLSYAIALVESSQPWFGPLAAAWLVSCSLWKTYQIHKSWAFSWQSNPMVRFVLAAAVALLVGQLLYLALAGGFIQPSEYIPGV